MGRPRTRDRLPTLAEALESRRQKLLKYIPDELLVPIGLLGEWDNMFLSDFEALHAEYLPALLKMELVETEETLLGEVIGLTRSGRLLARANPQWSNEESLQISRALLYRACQQQIHLIGKTAKAEKVKPFTAKVFNKKSLRYVQLKYPSPGTVSLGRSIETLLPHLEADHAKVVIYHRKPKNLSGLEKKYPGRVEAAALEPLEPKRRRKNTESR